MLKKILWKVGVYSCLSECLLGDGRDSAGRRVVSDTDTSKVLLEEGHKKNRPLCAPIVGVFFFAYKTYLEYLAVLKADKQKVG